jgi:N4-gp56 family major capsid protein
MTAVYPFSQQGAGISSASGITGTPNIAAAPTGYDGGQGLAPAIQTLWSKEILFQAMPILRFEQFAVKKTELGVAPGLQINFMRYINMPADQTPLVEGVRMETHAITAEQYSITVTEHGYAVAVSELLLNASFDDVMASASRLLGRNMALYLDGQARDTLLTGTSQVFGYQP